MYRLVLVSLALVPLAAGSSPCPPGTFYYDTRGLCYWQLLTQLTAAEAHGKCAETHQDGGLAIIPEPAAERFVIQHLNFSSYTTTVQNQCGANQGVCNTHWIGHRDVWGRGGAPSLWQGGPPPWRSPHVVNGTAGPCIQVHLDSNNDLDWYEVDCNVSRRRSLCSAWAEERVRRKRWEGREGRTTDSLLYSLTARSLPDCARRCHLRQHCASFNFRRATGTCELTYRVLDPPAHPLTSDPGFRHYELVD